MPTVFTDLLPPSLEGSLVTLRPLAPEHERPLFVAADHPEVWRWMPTNAVASREAFAGWIATALEAAKAGREGPFCVFDASGTPIGSMRYLALRPEHAGLEIGYSWLTPPAWRSGANVEAKLLLLEHAFDRLGCMRVEFKTDARNERSRRALEALGCRFDGIFPKHMLVRHGDIRDSAWYSIVDDDWPGVRARLETRLEGHR
jgi:RimJ/RimL family protein N-acetyltransferase